MSNLIFTRILNTDKRIYNDVKKVILDYFDNGLYEIYKKYYFQDSKKNYNDYYKVYIEDYIQMIHFLLQYLTDSNTLPYDNDETIKKNIEYLKEEILDNLNDGIKLDESYLDLPVLEDISSIFSNISYRKILFIINYMIPYLLEQKNIFEITIFNYPIINIKNIINYSTNKISLGLLSKIYLRILVVNRRNEYIMSDLELKLNIEKNKLVIYIKY